MALPQGTTREPSPVLGLPPHLAGPGVPVSSLVFLHPHLPFPLGCFLNSSRAGGAAGEQGRVTTQALEHHAWQLGTRVLRDWKQIWSLDSNKSWKEYGVGKGALGRPWISVLALAPCGHVALQRVTHLAWPSVPFSCTVRVEGNVLGAPSSFEGPGTCALQGRRSHPSPQAASSAGGGGALTR